MKTATIPSLRVDPKLRLSAESVLQEGESLSSFVEQAIRITIEHRQAQREFIARGLASRDNAQHTGVYIAADAVVNRLEVMLNNAKSAAKTPL
ncbi:MAG: prevent-host-death protein [Sterolibacterium sp.]|nr:prevent-host-death protein [Sterolibacterium sp.]